MDEIFKISLRAARVNAGLTVVKASKALGVCKERVIKWEKKPELVNPAYQKKISDAYKIPIERIFFGF